MRIEKDTMGEMEVPENAYYGAQSARSLMNFQIGTETLPSELIKAYAIMKKACAIINNQEDKLSDDKTTLITQAADEIIAGNLDDQFPLSGARL